MIEELLIACHDERSTKSYISSPTSIAAIGTYVQAGQYISRVASAYGHFSTYRDLSLRVGSQTQEAQNISKKLYEKYEMSRYI